MADKHTRLTLTIEDYDDAKFQRACLLKPEEVASVTSALQRCRMYPEVKEVTGPLYDFRSDRGGSIIESPLRTLDEIKALLEPGELAAAQADIDALAQGKATANLYAEKDGVTHDISIFPHQEPTPTRAVPTIPRNLPSVSPETPGASGAQKSR
jgi:hypothetical protein